MNGKEQILLIANIIKPAYCNKSDEACAVCMTGCRPYQEAERLYDRGCRVDKTIVRHVFNDLNESMTLDSENNRCISESSINKLKKKYGVN